MENKEIYVPSLVLMIVGLVFAFLIPLAAYVCCTISLVMSVKKRKKFKTAYAIPINIIALLIALANHIYTTLVLMGKI